MTTRVVAAYSLWGETLDPAAITTGTGLSPSDSTLRGTRIGQTPRVRQTSQWRLAVDLAEQQGVEEALTQLFAILRPAWPALTELGRVFEAEVVLSIEPVDHIPGIGVSRDHITALAELNAWFDIGIAADIVTQDP